MIEEAEMIRTPSDIVRELLENTSRPDVVRKLVAGDATYVSLNFKDHDLQKIMPYAGTHEREGPQAVIDAFGTVAKIWTIEAFEIQHLFGEGDNVAVFGTFTYRSTVVGRTITSPFAIMATVKDEKVVYMQFMEDTYATAASFQISGTAQYQSDPDGQPFDIAAPPQIA